MIAPAGRSQSLPWGYPPPGFRFSRRGVKTARGASIAKFLFGEKLQPLRAFHRLCQKPGICAKTGSKPDKTAVLADKTGQMASKTVQNGDTRPNYEVPEFCNFVPADAVSCVFVSAPPLETRLEFSLEYSTRFDPRSSFLRY